MTKMTNEQAGTLLIQISEDYPEEARMLDGHIAALTSERDALATELREALEERLSLRERVNALEAECLRLQLYDRDVRIPQLRREEERVTALRRIAADMEEYDPEASGRISKALGDDAPAPSETIGTPCDCGGVPHTHEAGEDCTRNEPSELDGLHGEMADPGEQGPECSACPERGDFERLCCKGPRQKVAAEPTTAEAFAMVRGEPLYSGFSNHGKHALSLLERRVGATRRALADAPHGQYCAWERKPCDCWKSRALTDAPPVFTLEEKDVNALSAGAAFLRTLHNHIHHRLEESNKDGLRYWAEKFQKMADALRR